jgi:signal peptidase II
MIKQKQNKILTFVLVFLFSFCADLYCSKIIVKKLISGEIFPTDSFIDLIYIKNTGAAFSILQNSISLLVVISIIAILFLIYYIAKNIENMNYGEHVATAFLMAGICGNLYERIHFGYVRDFFNLTFINFPIFNISDVFINIGVFAIILFVIFKKKPINL